VDSALSVSNKISHRGEDLALHHSATMKAHKDQEI